MSATATIALGHCDVLSHQARNLVRLFGLHTDDTLLHQIADLHVQEQCSVLGTNLTHAMTEY